MYETYAYSMYETNDYVLMYETYAYSVIQRRAPTTTSYLDRTYFSYNRITTYNDR